MLLVTQTRRGRKKLSEGARGLRRDKESAIVSWCHREALSLPPECRPDARHTCLCLFLLLTFVYFVCDSCALQQHVHALCYLLRKYVLFFWCLAQVSSSLGLKLGFSRISLWTTAHPLPQSLWGTFIWRSSFSAAGTDGTTGKYNGLASLPYPVRGV